MEMQKGVAIVERDDTSTKAVFIDHEVIEFARMNAKTKKNHARTEVQKSEANRSRRKAEKAEARRKAYMVNTFAYVLIRGGISVAAAWAGVVGLVAPVIAIPVILTCCCTACLRLGVYLGKVGRR